MDSTGSTENKRCDVCGKFCKEVGSAIWKTAFKCVDCRVVYYDRTEYNPEYTMGADRLGRDVKLE